MSRNAYAFLLVLLVFGLFVQSQSYRVQAQNETSTPVVRIDPAQTESLDVNDNFTIYVWVDGAVGVVGAQVQFTYDLTVLNATNVVEGPFVPSFGQTIVAQQCSIPISETVAEVYYASAITTGATASGSGILLNVTFTVLSEGSAQLHLIPFSASGTYPGTYFLNLQFTEITPNLVDGFYGSPVSLTASPALIHVGEITTLSGKVSGSSVANITSVDLMYAKQGGNWSDLGTVPTNSSGYFSRQWTASESGVFSFEVTFTLAGKTVHSPILDVVVQPRAAQGWGSVVLYAGLGVSIFIVAVATIVRVRRRGKGFEEPPPIP
jgi:hypothetical protein